MTERRPEVHPEATDPILSSEEATATAFDARGVLLRDRVFWLTSLIFVAVLVPYALPVFSPERLANWGSLLADVPLSIAALLAVVIGIRRLRAPTERRFWGLIAFGYASALFVESASAFTPASVWTATTELVIGSGYLVYYVGLVLATDVSRGTATDRGVSTLHRLHTVGLGVLAFGLIVYFDVVPSVAVPDGGGPWYPTLFLFALLDVGVCLAFLRVRRGHEDPRWRRILGGMALVSGLYAVVDGAEGLLYLDAFSDLELSPYWDLAWYVPSGVLIVVARLHLGTPELSRATTRRIEVPRPDRGSLVVGLLALPLIHALLYYLDILEPALREMRDGVVVVFLLVMGSMTLVYLRTLEREREIAARELKLSGERYRSFMHTRSDGVYRAEVTPPVRIDQPPERQLELLEERLRIAEANDVIGGMVYASDPAELIGLPLIDLLGPDRDRALEALRDWIDGGYDVDDLDITQETADGELLYFSCSLTGIVEGGELVRAWLTRSDVTRDRLAAVETERLELELMHSQKMDTIGTLAGGIAHDFNNILAPIMGFTELAVATTRPEDEATREHLAHVLRASHRAADLVQQILTVRRGQPRQEVPLQMADVIREALKLIRPGVPASIAIETSIAEACPTILGDPSQMHQVLMNLCTNASQAIGSAQGNIHIGLTCESEGDEEDAPIGWIVLTVRDDGPGMDASVSRRVFEPFFTTRAAGEGTGLGLSTVHGIVTSHGGTVTMESQLGAGTSFAIRFPATDRAEASPSVDLPADESGARILVVDDEEAVANLTQRLLESQGHTVTCFTDPVRALHAIQSGPGKFDLIVTDYTMPGLTGIELARAAQAFEPDLRVVIVSGYRLGSGDCDTDVIHLSKPFTSAQLAATVRRAISLPSAARAESD